MHRDHVQRGAERAADPAAYGDWLGDTYDTLYPTDGLETEATVSFLADLAKQCPGRSVLEFGVGTGRLAIALHERGVKVAGIEASEGMVKALRAKAPRATIDVKVGDFASTEIDGAFSVVALVFNTILDERGVPAQLATFANAARHLEPGGYFVIEAFVLGDDMKDGNWKVAPRYVGSDHVELQMLRFDIETSIVERTLVHLRPGGPQFVTVRDGYAGPPELDVMAQVHGFARMARYADWEYSPFTAQSHRHISVYKLM